jgi:beta-glucosidase
MKNKATELTKKEKSTLLQGTDFMYTHGVPRLGIPPLAMADGPHGLRKQIGGGDNGVSKSEPATAFPTAACVASSWNPENAEKIGRAIGEECRYYGVHMLLGPGLNIKRNPLGGRNFEYYSEDPLLAGKFGAAFVRGVQSMGVSACLKHFALNNQENFRFVGNSVADERAIREIYLKPFETTVKEGKPGAVMSSYNRINGTFACESKWLLTDVLREEWGFDGIVMSDWGGTHDRAAGVRAGEDIEMPGDTAVSLKKVYDAFSDGSLSDDEANACVTRILAATEKYASVPKTESFDRDRHAELAAEVAADSAVLMKNDGTLPLDSTKSICVIGELFEKMRYQGSGSSMISPTKVVTHKDAFDARGIKYGYARGYSAGVDPAEGEPIAEAVALAEKYDTVLLYLGLTDLAESEGGDREHMCLPDDQLALADALMKTGKKIAVVLSGGSPVELPFADGVNAILNLYLPGQCGGEAGAGLIFGEVNPSGKLAETWYKKYADVPYSDEYSKKANELYKESIFVGYRYSKTAKVKPAFPFGFGLSYTDFEYKNLAVTNENGVVTATLTVRNTGSRDGAEVVQLYVKNNENSAVYKPENELRAFGKVYLRAGEEKVVTLSVALSELSFWNIKTKSWTLENGDYTIEVGTSSEDIRLTAPLTVTEGVTATSPYPDSINEKMNGAKPVDNAAFADLLGTPLPEEPPVLPLTMESRFCDFQKTFMGRILYNAVCGVAKKQLKKAKKLASGPERDNRIKGAIFLQRIFDTNCVRTLSLSAGKSMPWNVAEGFVQLGNGHLIRGVAAMCKSYKIKGADKT